MNKENTLYSHISCPAKCSEYTYKSSLQPTGNFSYSVSHKDSFLKRFYLLPWLMRLSGLSAGLWTKGSLVQFPVGAHAWVVGQSWGGAEGRGGGRVRGSCTLMFLSFSLPSPLSKNKLKILKDFIYLFMYIHRRISLRFLPCVLY